MRYIIVSVFLLSSIFCIAQKTKVIRVVDGDTYVIESGERVRMIGIDAPEMSTDFGDDAKEHLKTLIEGKTIQMVDDKVAGDKDHFNRLLRYTVLDGADINLRMVCDGFAIAYTKYKFSKTKPYTSCQTKAEDKDLGMWLSYTQQDLYNKKEKKTAKKKKKEETDGEKNLPPIQSQEPSVPYLNYLLVSLASVVVVYLLSKLKRKRRR